MKRIISKVVGISLGVILLAGCASNKMSSNVEASQAQDMAIVV